MTDELDIDNEREERIQRLAENLRDVLKEGDEILIQFLNDEMRVSESRMSRLRAHQPRLHGRLLSIDEQLAFRFTPFLACLLLAGAALFGLQVGWWEGLLGADACDKLNAWWFYLVVIVVALFVGATIDNFLSDRTYARHRASLVQLMTECHFDRDLLVSLLNNEEELSRVVGMLKRDSGTFPPVETPPPPRLFAPKDEKR